MNRKIANKKLRPLELPKASSALWRGQREKDHQNRARHRAVFRCRVRLRVKLQPNMRIFFGYAEVIFASKNLHVFVSEASFQDSIGVNISPWPSDMWSRYHQIQSTCRSYRSPSLWKELKISGRCCRRASMVWGYLLIFVINPNGEFSKQMKCLFQKQCVYIYIYTHISARWTSSWFGTLTSCIIKTYALWCTPSAPKESSRLTCQFTGSYFICWILFGSAEEVKGVEQKHHPRLLGWGTLVLTVYM